MDFLKKHYKKIIVAVLTFMAIVSVLNAKNESAIFDETAHIPAGYSYVTQHDMRLNPEHPPLLKDMAGLPLAFMHLNFDTSADFWTQNPDGQWEAGRSLLWHSGNDADKIIFGARLPFVLLSLIFVLFIFFWTRELAGTLAGLFALVLVAFDPNILGHNHFVTTDTGIAAFMTFSFYFFLRFVKNPSWKNVLWAGFFLGLVQLAKFSAVILFPVFALSATVYPLCKNPRNGKNKWKFRAKKLGEYVLKGLTVFGFSLVIVWILYFLNTYKMPSSKLDQIINYQFSQQSEHASAQMMGKALLALDSHSITKPFAEYFLGVGMVFKRVAGGNGAYFMGQVSSSAFPLYFPTVFLLKEPIVSLFCILLALSLTILSFSKYLSSHQKIPFSSFVRQNITPLSLFTFIALYVYISVTGNLNIGFRHLFPILPFTFILTSKVIFDHISKLHKKSRHTWHWIVAILSVFLISGTVASYPYYMSYFNQAGGGSKNGYRYVTDSNADWGQDLKRFKNWMERYNRCQKTSASLDSFCKIYDDRKGPIEKIHLNYFGGADIHYYFGDQAIDWWDSRRPLEMGWYALSTNYLQGSIYDKTKPNNQSYRWTRRLDPVAQVGTSIFVYYLTPQQADEINNNNN